MKTGAVPRSTAKSKKPVEAPKGAAAKKSVKKPGRKDDAQFFGSIRISQQVFSRF